jgi:mannose-6-phosphate isomerase-like protein (cupin superfamily)
VSYRTHYREHLGSREDKHFKATLFEGLHLMVGINCLDPGQVQAVHTHAAQDKFYAVQEGSGHFSVGEERFEAGPGEIVWAPAGVEHGVENRGAARLVLMVCIAPPPH